MALSKFFTVEDVRSAEADINGTVTFKNPELEYTQIEKWQETSPEEYQGLEFYYTPNPYIKDGNSSKLTQVGLANWTLASALKAFTEEYCDGIFITKTVFGKMQIKPITIPNPSVRKQIRNYTSSNWKDFLKIISNMKFNYAILSNSGNFANWLGAHKNYKSREELRPEAEQTARMSDQRALVDEDERDVWKGCTFEDKVNFFIDARYYTWQPQEFTEQVCNILTFESFEEAEKFLKSIRPGVDYLGDYKNLSIAPICLEFEKYVQSKASEA